MPIYAYRCGVCGHAKDVLQKLADPVLTTCPACGAEAFSKLLTAAGFQLKGSGWYATDFKGGAAVKGNGDTDSPPEKAATDKPAEKAGDGAAVKAGEKSSDSSAVKSGDSAPAAAGSCGAGCGCH